VLDDDVPVVSLQFLRADLALARTFLSLAQSRPDDASRSRLVGKARVAHDSVAKLLNVLRVTEDERVEVELALTTLARTINHF
jgi:hypothetical protein